MLLFLKLETSAKIDFESLLSLFRHFCIVLHYESLLVCFALIDLSTLLFEVAVAGSIPAAEDTDAVLETGSPAAPDPDPEAAEFPLPTDDVLPPRASAVSTRLAVSRAVSFSSLKSGMSTELMWAESRWYIDGSLRALKGTKTAWK